MFLLAALAFLVLVVQLACAADDPAGQGIRRLKNLVEQCAFSLGDHDFNLCPILNGNDGGWKVESERRTPPTVTKTSYRIDLKEPLKRDAALPGHEQVRIYCSCVRTKSRSRVLFNATILLHSFARLTMPRYIDMTPWL